MTRMNEKAIALMEILSEECKTPADVTATLKELFAGTLEKMLEGEMEEHLGYEKNSVIGNNSGNSRNGYGKKTIKSEWGESELSVPRDRNGTFEPQVIEKRQTRTDDIEARVLAMYAKGMSTRDIEDHLFNSLPRFRWDSINEVGFDNGVYIVFEDGEHYFNMDRILMQMRSHH